MIASYVQVFPQPAAARKYGHRLLFGLLKSFGRWLYEAVFAAHALLLHITCIRLLRAASDCPACPGPPAGASPLQLPVQVLAFAPSAGFALSAAEGERLVAVWATPSKQGGRKKAGAGAAASLAVEQPVVGLSTVGEWGCLTLRVCAVALG